MKESSPINSLGILNLLMHLSGSISSIIDFKIKRIKRVRFIWFIYSIVFGVLFISSYPISILKLFRHTPSDQKDSINYRLNILFYFFTFSVTALIYLIQFRYSRKVTELQNVSTEYYQQIDKINRQFCLPQNKEKSFKIFNCVSLAKVIFTLCSYMFSSYLKLTQIFHWPIELNIFDVFWFFYPILFTHLYCNFFAQTIKQQANICEFLNETLAKTNYAMDTKLNSSNESKISVSRQLDSIMFHQPSIALHEKNIRKLITIHQKLRKICFQMGKMQSIPIFCILLNAFVNVVTQLWFVFNDTIEISFAPVVWMNCALGVFFTIEIITIITPCNRLNNVVRNISKFQNFERKNTNYSYLESENCYFST